MKYVTIAHFKKPFPVCYENEKRGQQVQRINQHQVVLSITKKSSIQIIDSRGLNLHISEEMGKNN